MKNYKRLRDTEEYDYCSCGKRIFYTRHDADTSIRQMQKKRKQTCSIYQCNQCGHFHLTHLSYQQSKDIRQQKDKCPHDLTEA